MVQNSSDRNLSTCFGMNEFQVVHALITQTLKGSKDAQFDENDNDVVLEPTSQQNNLLSAIYQTFNSVNPSNGKRLFPRYVKDFVSQIRQSQGCLASPSSALQCEKQFAPSSFHSTCCNKMESSKVSIESKGPPRLSSNVQSKVLQFEKQANPITERICATCRSRPDPTCSTSEQESCAEVCPGGTFYRPVNHASKATNPKPAAPPLEQEHSSHHPLSGRNLKRTPSEKFQKIRRKVQKLMHRSRNDEAASPTVDEATYLNSIRIPVPTEGRRRLESSPCLILRLPDHVLCRVFEMLDTRTLASVKSSCSDFSFIINNFDIRSTDSGWTKDERYLSDPCKQCRHLFVRGDMSMCRFHPKRFYSDLPYGRSYWMCCFKNNRSDPGCKTGLHDNHWHNPS